MNLFPYKNFYPKISPNVFLAPGAKIIGDVEILEDSSVWYNTVVRGDINYIRIGSMTNVQDNAVLHVTGKNPLIIGNKVTIGHSAVLHGCTIKDFCLIGMGGIILDNAVIEEKTMIAAGALVTQDFVVHSGKLAGGVPARIIRDLTDSEFDELENIARRYKEYAELTKESLKNSMVNRNDN
jgi:carbonic anhydrase/acetyltransferase-like protein (isoleucine patch superfamily)